MKHRFFPHSPQLLLLVVLLSLSSPSLFGQPSGGVISAGQGSIAQPSANRTMVVQTTPSMVIDWSTYNLSAQDKVQYIQPSVSATSLNRILDQNPSQILGSIQANGRVFLLNPNGIIFGESAIVNVGSLVASGMNISNEDFLKENYKFDTAVGSIVNRGLLTAATGGSINLMGKSVVNEGVILANKGQINIGAGRKITLDFDGDGLISFQVDEKLLDSNDEISVIANSGEIIANGGSVLLNASIAENVVSQAINNSGYISAGRIENKNGVIRLVAEDNNIINSGKLSVSALDEFNAGEVSILSQNIAQSGEIEANGGSQGDGGNVVIVAQDTLKFNGDISVKAGDKGDGGFTELSGLEHVYIDGKIHLDAESGEAGTLLIDPGSINIVDGLNTLPPASLDTFNDAWIEDQLGSGNLILQTTNSTNGGAEDILIDAAASISWANTNSLTLDAGRNITVDGAVTAASGTLNLQAGQNGAGSNIDLSNGTISVSAVTLTGGAGSDTITGMNAATTWNITGTNSGNINGTFDFSSIENLVGGTNSDTFNINSNFSGNISGGSGTDLFDFANTTVVTGAIDGNAGIDTLDWADYTTTRDVTLTGLGSSDGVQGQQTSITGNFDNVDVLISSNNSDTLTGANSISVWTITGANDGNIVVGPNSVSFTNYSDLVGGSALDAFSISGGSVSGAIDGGGDTDILSADNDGETFVISGASAGNLGDVAGGFSNMEVLVGGTGNDAFTMNVNFAGGINGGAGTDTIDYTPLSSPVTVTLDPSYGAGEVTAIETLIGEPGSTLIGNDGDSTWTISATDVGNVVWAGGTTAFSGFTTITGGDFVDTFNLDSDFTNTINGGDGNDIFDIETSVSGTLNGSDGNDTFNIAVSTGNITNVANGDLGNDTFNINENISGSLTGGIGVDSFIFADTKIVTGSVDGGSNSDTLDLSAYTTAITWSLTGAGAGNVNGNNIDFTGIENIEGGSNVDTFTYATGSSIAGLINSYSGNDIFTFQNGSQHLGSIDGGVGDETVTFENGSTFDGSSVIDGGANSDSVDYSALGSATVRLETHVTNIETLTGGGVNFTLFGDNSANTWTIDGGGSEVVGGYTFSGFNSLVGGTGVDTFNITFDYVDSILGESGNDIFNINVAITNSINGGDGNDIFNLNTNFSGTVSGGNNNDTFNLVGNITTGIVDGGTGTDTVVGDDLDNTWAINSASAGTVTNTNGSVTFSAVESLTGLTGVDTFNIATAGTMSGSMSGGAGDDLYVYSLNSTITGTIDGGDGTDSVDYSAIDAIRTVTLGSSANVTMSTETLTGDTDAAITLVGSSDAGSTWTTTGAMAGTVLSSANTVTFTDMTNLTGGTLSDIFNLDAAFSGVIGGGTGTDTFNITNGQSIGSISGGSGNDIIVADDVANTWTITGQNAGNLNGQTFSAIENLTGGTNTDTFNFDDGDGVNGAIDGGTGASVDTLDMSNYTTALSFTLSGVGSDNGLASTSSDVGDFDNINTLVGGGSSTDLLTGYNAAAAWGIDGTNQYTATNTLDFSSFENLTGGSSADIFTITGAQSNVLNGGVGNDQFIFISGAVLTGLIDGAAGTDEINWSAYTSRNIALSATGSTDGFNGNDNSASDSIASGGTDFSNIDTIISSTGGSTDSITGMAATAAWGIDGSNQYISGNTLSLSNFETLNGGTGADTFTITGAQSMVLNGNNGDDDFVFADNAANLTGTIDGGSGSDTLDWSAVTVNRDVSISTTGAANGLTGTQVDSISVDFDNINSVTGTNTGDTLTGPNAVNTWDISGADDGTLTSGGRVLAFTDYANLLGGTNDDSFNFGALGGLSGQISDGGGASDSVDYSTVTAPVVVIIGSDISGIEIVTGDNVNDTLVGSNIANTWNITGENDGTVGSVTFVDMPNLTGGTNDDDFILGALGSITGLIDGAADVVRDTVDYSAVDAAVTVRVGTDVTNIERLTGDATNDKIVGPNVVNVWTINGTEDGNLLTSGDTIEFFDMKNIDGGSDVDTFTISADYSGVIAALGGADIFNLNSTLTTGAVDGGNDDDIFNYSNGVSIVGFTGGSGTDTLVADNVANTWNLSGSDSGTLNGQIFLSMEMLVGNADVDTFNINSNFSGTLSGEGNNDIFNFLDTTTVGGLIDGGIGTDILNWTNYTTSRTITLSALGTDTGFAGTETSTLSGFDSIDSITGSGTTGGSITGIEATASWDIDGTNQYTSTNILNFSSFNNLTGGNNIDIFNLDADYTGNLVGGSGDDIFDFANGFNLTGSIDGGVGSDTLDWADHSTGRSITLSALGADNGFAGADFTSGDNSITDGFENINTLTGSSTATNQLTGINAIASWGIDGTNQYTSTNTLDFSNFQNLIGGSFADTFNLANDHTGNLNGGAGDDIFDFADTINIIGAIDGDAGDDTIDWVDYTVARSIALTTQGSSNGFAGADNTPADNTISLGFENINTLIGTGSDTLTGMNAAASWNIDGSNQYDSSNILNFSAFTTLIGNAESDTFNITGAQIVDLNGGAGDDAVVFTDDTATLTGSVDGGTGSNSLSWIAALTNRDITITGLGANVGFAGTQATISGSFDNIDYVIGSSSGGDTLTGPDADTAWTFTTPIFGEFVSNARTLGFSNYENYIGGNQDDYFTTSTSGTILGTIDGGGQSTRDTVDYSVTSVATQVNLGIDIFNIETVIGDGNLHSLVAENQLNTWNITDWDGAATVADGALDGTLTNSNVVNFADFSTLIGGSNSDDFTLNGGTLGSIDGVAGIDSLQANDVANNWLISSVDGGTVTGVVSFSNIENITGGIDVDNFVINAGSVTGILNGGAGLNSLTADNTANNWDITGANLGAVTSVNAFQQINDLVGGSANDVFILNGGTISGSVNGGLGEDSINGDDVAATWNILSANIGDVTGIGSFSSIENLTGGSSTDDFIFASAGTLSGSIDGAGNSDSVDMSAILGDITVDLSDNDLLNIENYIGNNSATLVASNTANIWRINNENDGLLNAIIFNDFNILIGGSNTDDFILSSSGRITGSIQGSDGIDTLTGNNLENIWNITAADTGNMTNVQNFSSIENLIGNDNTDSFVFSAGSSLSGNIDGGGSIDTLDYALLAGPLTVSLNDSTRDNLEIFIGNNESTFQALDIDNDWVISDENDGTVGIWSFFNFNNLQGGSETDNFLLSGGSIVGGIDGNSGNDSITANDINNTWLLNADNTGTVTSVGAFESIENLSGGSADDTFQVNGFLVTGVINGIAGSNTFISDNSENNWLITAANTGSLNGQYSFLNINNLVGGTNIDRFTLAGGTIDGSVNGGDGNDTLFADNRENQWNITGENSGNVTGFNQFSNIENLMGNSNADNYVFSSTGDISGIISGGGETDVIDYRQRTEVITVQLGDDGISNIETILANNLDNSLIAEDIENSWVISAQNSGQVNNINFSGFANLTGGNGTDTFLLDNGSITGSLDGAAGSDSLTANNRQNSWIINNINAGVVGDIESFANVENIVGGSEADNMVFTAQGEITGTVDLKEGIDSIDYSAVNSAMDISIGNSLSNAEIITAGTDFTLTADNSDNNWNITTVGSGRLNNIEFTGFRNLVGGTANDIFTISGSAGVAGFVDGGSGIDTMDWTAYFTIRTVTLTGDGTIDGFKGNEESIGAGFDNVEKFIGTDVISSLAESLAAAGKNMTDDLYRIAYQKIPNSIDLTPLFTITGTRIQLREELEFNISEDEKFRL